MNNELTAALATIEKCREVSGCPAGVDLQDHLRQLAAENVGLNKFIVESCFVQAGEVPSWYQAIDHAPETPATDRIYSGIKADGVEEWVSSRGGRWNGTTEEALKFAAQLRKGAAK